jgi:hypothetical protein
MTLGIRIAIPIGIARHWTLGDANLMTGSAVGRFPACSSRSGNNLREIQPAAPAVLYGLATDKQGYRE